MACSCSAVTSAQITAAVAEMRATSPALRITPGKVYRHLDLKPCGGCLPVLTSVIKKVLSGQDTASVVSGSKPVIPDLGLRLPPLLSSQSIAA